MKTVIEMAREAGFDCAPDGHIYADGTDGVCDREIKRFAELVRADERNRTWTQDHWTEYERSIVEAEREVIAQSLDKQADLAPDEIDRRWAQEMAAAVRARGEKI
jgi:hypothetical protein